LVLVCIHRAAQIHTHLRQYAYFGVNILNADQEQISRRFASKEAERFGGVDYSYGDTANIECGIAHFYLGGDHTIFVGEVEKVAVAEGGPLIYFRRRYAHVQ
jgi:flavin reductase (DIM6/NTAB) family NADH-FMN oxidoreductase RutF